MNYIPILSALIPALLLLGYIYWQDRKSPEPVKQLLKATAMGVLSIPLTFCILTPLSEMGFIAEDATTFGEAINIAFFGAAIPEELAKLLVLWLLLRKNKYFDERMDGIVYAVCVSLGFAGLENILYVVGDEDICNISRQLCRILPINLPDFRALAVKPPRDWHSMYCHFLLKMLRISLMQFLRRRKAFTLVRFVRI